MRASILQAVKVLEEVDLPRPQLASGEALVEMHAVGVCGSDLAAFTGHHPFRHPPVILGHEGAGRVVETSGEVPVEVGDHVAILPLIPCHACRRCEQGLGHLCEHRRVPGRGWSGLLAEYVPAAASTLVPLAAGTSFQEGAMVEPLAVAWHTLRVAEMSAGASVAVLGGGTIGSLVAALARQANASQILVSDVRTSNLALAERLTGCATVDPTTDPVPDVGRRLVGDEGFDVVVIASGHPTCLEEALALAGPRGTVIVLPMFAAPLQANLTPLVLSELIVRGATTYTPSDFRAAAAAVNDRRFDVQPWLSAARSFAETPIVFEELGGVERPLKAHIDPSR